MRRRVNLQFRSVLAPPTSLIEQLAVSDPENPFCTLEYATACESLGGKVCFLGLCSGDQIVSGCTGVLSGSFLRRSLSIHSLPPLPTAEVFWSGLLQLCRALKVWYLEVDTFASPSANIPQLSGELARKRRWEYILDIEGDNFFAGVRRTHRGNIKRAIKAGLSVRRTREEAACAEHMKLIGASMERRAGRGEEVAVNQSSARPMALLDSGLGELFQALDGNKILSSMLILRSTRGAYWQSAGTRPEGMQIGASPFLLSRVATTVKEEGARVFNLGGASEDNPGLRDFKSGFGTREVALQAASFCPRSGLEREIHAVLRTGWSWMRRR
ncbi:MAG: GNAT family N-acetyltransferase [Terriglobales bacterium]